MKLEGNMGRYPRVSFDARLCPLCYSDVETEFHFLMICPSLMTVRRKYLTVVWYTYPSINKFVQLCNSSNPNTITNIARYILCAMKVKANLLTN